MQLSVTGRHVEVTEPIRTHIEKKLDKVHSYFDDIIDVRVVLSVEKYRKFAEVTITGRNNIHFHCEEATDDMYVSIDKAVDKMERQLRRHISKVRKTKRRKGAEPQPDAEASEDEDSDYDKEIEVAGEYRVSVSNKIPAKPMSVEEAILQLEASEDEFMAFINQQTDEVNVVHRKKDGGYGMLRRSD